MSDAKAERVVPEAPGRRLGLRWGLDQGFAQETCCGVTSRM
jgi:hypothetical protein